MARICTAVFLGIFLIGSGLARAQLAVIDAAVLKQEIIQITKLVREIELTAELLDLAIKNSNKGVTTYNSPAALLLKLGQLLQRGQGIAYTMSNIDEVFTTTFPTYKAPKNWHTSYVQWNTTSLDTLRNTLASLGVMADEISWDAQRIAGLASISSGAAGRRAGIQAGNNIAMAAVQQRHRLAAIEEQKANAYAVVEAKKEEEAAANDAKTREFFMTSDRKIPAYGSSGLGIGRFAH